MEKDKIKNILINNLPEELIDELLENYVNSLKEFRKGNWKYFSTEIATFNEIIFRILEYLLTANYTAINNKLPKFNEKVLLTWEAIPNKDENIRIIIPRILYSMFCIRNKRGAIHKNHIIPNKMDANLLLSNAKWIISELIRTYSSLGMDDAENLIDSIQSKEVDFIWNVDSNVRILNLELKCQEQILVLLYIYNTLSIDELLKNIEYSNKSVFKKYLVTMHKKRLLELMGDKCTISPIGIVEAEKLILKANPTL